MRTTLVAGALLVASAYGCGSGDTPAAAPAPAPPAVQSAAPSADPATSSAAPQPSASSSATASFVVTGGKLTSGPRAVRVDRDSPVVLEVVSDAADEMHVHGYDRMLSVQPGSTARISFTADITGVFEVELHSGIKLCELRVG